MTTTTNQAVEPGSSAAWQRRCEIEQLLEERHPESRDLLGELSDLSGGDLINEAMAFAVEHQGEVILAAICGELVAWPGCTPQWIGRPVAS